MSLPVEEMADSQLDLIKKLGSAMKQKHTIVKEKEQELAQAKANYNQIAEVMLPEQMEDLGITEIVLHDGTKISLTKFYNAKIPQAAWSDAIEWLQANNHDGIIKSGFSVALPKGQSELGTAAKRALSDIGIDVIVEDKIHPSTLKAFVREQIEQGADLPKEKFGVYEGQRVTFK